MHLSAFRKGPVDGFEKIGVNQVQVARGRSDVGMAHHVLDDVDVLTPAHEARGVGGSFKLCAGRLVRHRLGQAAAGHSAMAPSPDADIELAHFSVD